MAGVLALAAGLLLYETNPLRTQGAVQGINGVGLLGVVIAVAALVVIIQGCLSRRWPKP